MFIVMFTRLTGCDQEAIFISGIFESFDDAKKGMLEAVDDYVDNKGFERRWVDLQKDQAFLGSADMYDTVRFYIFDTDKPNYGFSNDRSTEWLAMTGRLEWEQWPDIA